MSPRAQNVYNRFIAIADTASNEFDENRMWLVGFDLADSRWVQYNTDARRYAVGRDDAEG